jgi:polyisoprenoid-binding protein YceI
MSTHDTHAIGAPSISATRWRLDPARSAVEFRVPAMWGTVKVKGRFTRYRGTLDLGAEPAIELIVEAESLDTKNRRRDKHLRSGDFFGVDEHPYVRFVSESAVLDGERLTIRGRLHARGASMPIALEATLRQDGDELELDAATHADHRRLGMTWTVLGSVGTPSTLTVSGRLVRDDD